MNTTTTKCLANLFSFPLRLPRDYLMNANTGLRYLCPLNCVRCEHLASEFSDDPVLPQQFCPRPKKRLTTATPIRNKLQIYCPNQSFCLLPDKISHVFASQISPQMTRLCCQAQRKKNSRALCCALSQGNRNRARCKAIPSLKAKDFYVQQLLAADEFVCLRAA